MNFNALPALGQPLENGIFAGLTTNRDGTHCAVVLLPEKPSKRLNWSDGMAWAAEQSAVLPDRSVSALLFATTGDQFEKAWHWTSESSDGAYAWSQNFGNGHQISNHKSYEGHCRAVRLIRLDS